MPDVALGAPLADAGPDTDDVVGVAPPRGALVRLAESRRPRRAGLLLVALVALTAAASAALPVPAALAPALTAAVLSSLWCGAVVRVAVAVVLGAALLPSLPATPTALEAGAAALAALALAVTGRLVARCTDIAVAARTTALRATVGREDDVRAAQQSQRELVGQLHYWSTHDALTGLLNRTAFVGLVDATLAAGHPVGVMVVSLAGFTGVNERLGERADAALVHVGQALVTTARGGDVVARLSGDTFGVLLTGLVAHDAPAVGARLMQSLDAPFHCDDEAVALRARCAIAVVPAGGDVIARALLRSAEASARTATVGRPPTVVAGAAPPVLVDTGLSQTDLARGIAADELFLLYQPLVSGATGRISSVEVLVRWRHPERGLVPPDAFIGLAERTGLILPLGVRVLEMACAQLRAWQQTAPYLTVAVNVSARQLVEPGFVEEVRTVLWRSHVDPARVVLELTESLLVEDSDAAVAVLWQLRSLGVRLALDDFGTGYSSLARLGEMPLDEMKIDKSFVDRLGLEPRDSATLVTAAVAMGHGLGLEVVAEGVETAAQAAFLRDVGCDLLQGYLVGKPQSPEDVTTQLGRPLLPPPGAVPAPRTDVDRVVVPAVMPSIDVRRRG